jgi:hypothetical protein
MRCRFLHFGGMLTRCSSLSSFWRNVKQELSFVHMSCEFDFCLGELRVLINLRDGNRVVIFAIWKCLLLGRLSYPVVS